MGVPSLREQADEVFALIEDERHLAALELLGKVQERLANDSTTFTRKSSFRNSSKQQRSWRRSSKRAATKEVEEVQQLLAQKASTLDTLQKRCQLFQQALENVDGKNDEEWTLASSHFGIQTLYRREPDGSLSIKLEGELKDAPLFEQVCVLREFDLHCKWSPCCTASRTIANLGKLDTVGWFCIGSFGLLRDGCVRLIGCDHAVESGKVIVTGHGVRDIPVHMEDGDAATQQPLDDPELLDSLPIPPIPTKKGTGRMTIRTLQAVIEVTSPTSATTKLVANMDPNVSILPNCLLELALKNIAGLVLLQMQGAARAVPKHPHSNPHAVRMRQDRAFYQDWLWPKCQRLCESHGWTMTPVHYFDEESEQSPASAVQQGPNNITSHSQHAIEKSMGGPAIVVTTPTSGPASDKQPNETSDRMVPLPATASVDDGHETSTLNTGSTCNGTTVEEEEGDTIASEWSKDSVLRQWLRRKKFPGAHFLRQQRERRRARKAKQQVVEKPDNLRAQTLSASQRARLAALQRANTARTASSTTLESQRTTHHHSTATRVMVMSSLIAAMVVALHPSLVWSSSQHERPWATLISSDTEAILSIFLCAIPHFLLCDVGLLYAFDGLELGTKAGARTKAFYSETVRYYMMVLSLGAAAVSVALAAIHHAVCESTYGWVRRLGRCSAATTSWTDEAYGTARSLFFYSSMGLVWCVVFFYLWLRQRSQTDASSSPSGVPKTITMLSRPPSSASTTASSEDEASLPQPQQS